MAYGNPYPCKKHRIRAKLYLQVFILRLEPLLCETEDKSLRLLFGSCPSGSGSDGDQEDPNEDSSISIYSLIKQLMELLTDSW